MSDIGPIEPSDIVEPSPPRAVVSLIFKPSEPLVFDWPPDFAVENIDFTRLDSLELADIGPPPGAVEDARVELIAAGFTIEGATEVGLSFSGTWDDFQLLGFDPFECGRGRARPCFVRVSEVVPNGEAFATILTRVVAFEVAVPAVLVWTDKFSGTPVPTDLTGLRNYFGLEDGSNGTYVRVRLVDSGFPQTWPDQWPMANLTHDDVKAIGDLDPNSDESGHGMAVAAHILSIAPNCELSMRKFIDESGVRNYPVAGFQQAVRTYSVEDRQPDVIVCSWVLAGTSVALQLEIANAQRLGILVVFASGNADMSDEAPESNPGITPFTIPDDAAGEESTDVAYKLCPIAHPDALSVGGVTKRESPESEFSTMDYTPVGAHFSSLAFVYPGGNSRSCPDIVGLTAPLRETLLELPGLIVTPTSVGSTLDRKPDGSDAPEDGRFKSAGTSMTAGQVAGMAALLIQTGLRLYPDSVRNVLTNTARHGEDPPWDERVGHGVASPAEALQWLADGFEPFIRKGNDPSFTYPTWPNPSVEYPPSPDIILLPAGSKSLDGARRLRQCFKHIGVAELDDPDGTRAFVRVQNHGKSRGVCNVTVAIIDANRFMTIVGTKPIGLDPGGFKVVGPFGLPSGGVLLAAEVVPHSSPSILKQFLPLVPLFPLTEAKLEQIQTKFAGRGV